MESKEYFDARSGEWSELYASDKRFQRRKEVLTELLKEVKESLPPVNDQMKAVDLGCGTGVFTRILASLGFESLGIDHSPKMIEYARSLSEPGIEYQSADLNELQQLPTTNLCIALSLLEYLEHPEYLLSLMSDNTAAGGVIVVTVPNSGFYRIAERIGRKVFSIISSSRKGEYLDLQQNALQPRTLDSLMEQMGFRRIRSFYFNAGFVLTPISSILESKPWWGAMYAAAYQKNS